MIVEYRNEGPEMKLYGRESRSLKIKFKAHWLKDSQISEGLIKFGDVNLPIKVDYSTYMITVYWEYCSLAVKNMFQHFLRVFNPVISIEFRIDADGLVSGILDVIKQENARLEEVSTTDFSTNDRVYQRLLDLTIRKLRITLNTKLKVKNFNNFLKKWIVPDSSLEYAKVSLNSSRVLNLKSIVEGLSTTPMKRVCLGGNFLDFENGKCFGLQRSNGEKAIVHQLDAFSVIIQTETFRDLYKIID